jgi:hypothetical protein
VQLQRVCAAATVVVLSAAAVVGAAGRSEAATRNRNACKWSLDANYRNTPVTLAGTPKGKAAAGTSVRLTRTTARATLPDALVAAGFGVGFLQEGRNDLPVEVTVAIAATNTSESVQVVRATTTASTTITVRDGKPSATPINATVKLPDTVWTAAGDKIAFKQAAPATIGSVPGAGRTGEAVVASGSVFIHATVGTVALNLDCAPGRQNPDAKDGNPPFTTYLPAARVTPFATVTDTDAK